MFDFLGNIFGKNIDKKNCDSNCLKLYFDRSKQTFIEINTSPDITINEIFERNKEEIFKKLQLQENVLIHTNDYSFIIIDEDCLMTELKLKLIDSPFKFLKKKTNLFYLNIKEKEKPKEEKPSMMKNNCECIRQGEIFKYSNKKKNFIKKTLILNKEELIYKDDKKKKTNIILLTDISGLVKETSIKNEKYSFQIETYDHEKYIFSSKARSDKDSWIEAINYMKTLNSDNKCINNFSISINNHIRDIYEKEKKICDMCFSPMLNEMMSLSELRGLILEIINDKLITFFIENYYNYMLNMKNFYYHKAREFAQCIIESIFQNEIYYEEIISKEKKDILDIKVKQSNLNKGNGSKKDNLIIERTTVFEKPKNTHNYNRKSPIKCGININERRNQFSKSPLSIKQLSSSNNPKEEEIDNNKKYQKHLSSLSCCKFEEILENMNETKSNEPNTVNLSNLTKTDNMTKLSLKNLESIENLTDNQKQFLFCSVSSYKTLKTVKSGLEIKDLELKTLNDTNLSFKSQRKISDQKGYNEFLKLDIFKEIYDNILYYIKKFFRKELRSVKFTDKLQEILIHYWKKNNNFNDIKNLISIELPKRLYKSETYKKDLISFPPNHKITSFISSKNLIDKGSFDDLLVEPSNYDRKKNTITFIQNNKN